jgi:hypothetical protein
VGFDDALVGEHPQDVAGTGVQGVLLNVGVDPPLVPPIQVSLQEGILVAEVVQELAVPGR